MYVYFNTVTDNDANVFKNKNLYFIDKPYGYTNDRVEVLQFNIPPSEGNFLNLGLNNIGASNYKIGYFKKYSMLPGQIKYYYDDTNSPFIDMNSKQFKTIVHTNPNGLTSKSFVYLGNDQEDISCNTTIFQEQNIKEIQYFSVASQIKNRDFF